MAKILVVDGSLSETQKLCGWLSQSGHHVITTSYGADGVALCLSEQPDAVVSDVMMSELNGYQVARQLSRHQSTRHIPVILLSAQDHEADREWGQRQGAKSVLNKPLNEHQLLATLNQWLVDVAVT